MPAAICSFFSVFFLSFPWNASNMKRFQGKFRHFFILASVFGSKHKTLDEIALFFLFQILCQFSQLFVVVSEAGISYKFHSFNGYCPLSQDKVF